MKKEYIIVIVAVIIVLIGLFWYNSASAATIATPPTNQANPTGATAGPATDCQGICQGICRKYPVLFSGRQRCKNKCISDCTIGVDVIANASNY